MTSFVIQLDPKLCENIYITNPAIEGYPVAPDGDWTLATCVRMYVQDTFFKVSLSLLLKTFEPRRLF